MFFGDDPAAAPEIPLLDGFDGRPPDLVEGVSFAAAIDHAIGGLMDDTDIFKGSVVDLARHRSRGEVVRRTAGHSETAQRYGRLTRSPAALMFSSGAASL
jgi:hypothetical protein